MILAVAYESGSVFAHFGRTENFLVYEIDGGTINKRELRGTNGLSHAELVGLLASWNVDVLLVGGIGSHALDLLNQKGIDVYTGVEGDAEKNVIDYLNGKLSYDPSKVHQCSHNH